MKYEGEDNKKIELELHNNTVPSTEASPLHRLPGAHPSPGLTKFTQGCCKTEEEADLRVILYCTVTAACKGIGQHPDL